MKDQNNLEGENKKVQRIEEHLRAPEAQDRINRRIQLARSQATVSISRAASLFEVSEQQLRDWTARGLLKAERSPAPFRQDGKQVTGHRQYTLNELDKLAIIKELIDAGDFTLGEIPSTLAEIWLSIQQQKEQRLKQQEQPETLADSLSFAESMETAKEKHFLRSFVPHILRLCLTLLSKDITTTSIGLALPLHTGTAHQFGQEETALVGWLNQDPAASSFYTIWTSLAPLHKSHDYNLQALHSGNETNNQEPILLILPRGNEQILPGTEFVETMYSLLTPLYTQPEKLRSCFAGGTYDVCEIVPLLTTTMAYADLMLSEIADMIIDMGGKVNGQNRWLFSCILLPDEPIMPLQKTALSVKANSKFSPYKKRLVSVLPDQDFNSLSLRAFQSGNIVYRSGPSLEDTRIAFREMEPTVHSAIAVPLGSENGEPVAVLYVTSNEQNAFLEKDRRLLRLIGKIVEEVLKTYAMRRQEANELSNLMLDPDNVDTLLGNFLSENQFNQDMKDVLKIFRSHLEKEQTHTAPLLNDEETLSFIAIDIDNQGSLLAKYGNQFGRNLCKEVGQRILGEIQSMFKKYRDCRCFYMGADRFYIMLNGITFEQVKSKARQLKRSLDGSYKVSILQSTGIYSLLPGTLHEETITVRLAISSYTQQTIEELLRLRTDQEVLLMIDYALDTELKKGMERGGNVIRYYDLEKKEYALLPLDE